MTPLSATVWFEAVGLGLHEAMRELHGPFGGFLARIELGWAYEGELDPDWEIDVESVRDAARTLDDRWERETKPRVHQITATLQRMRPELLPPDDAVRLLDSMWELVREQWTWHFLTVIPAQFAVEMLRERYVEVSGEDAGSVYTLLQGAKTERTEADRMLWALAAQARDQGIDDVIREYPTSLVRERLAQTHQGRIWLQALDTYLLRFGGRVRWHELSLPREAEQPTMTLESIRLFLEGASAQNRLIDSGSAAESLAERVPALRELLHVGAAGHRLKEDHTYHIDYSGLLATREVLLGFGRRLLAEGRVESAEDVWMLTRLELRAALADPDLIFDTMIQHHRDEMARGKAAGVQPYLGEPPAEADRHVVLEHFYGSRASPMAGSVLAGIAASGGEAEGLARVVTSLEDFRRVRVGDVLVSTTTTPAWTPLFPSLAALVTETGGVLSHAAVVAREYRLPAVVGVEGVTGRIRDGDRVRVNGTRGQVTILATASVPG